MGDKIDKLALSLAAVGIASVFRKKLREHMKAQEAKVQYLFCNLLHISKGLTGRARRVGIGLMWLPRGGAILPP